MIGEYIASYVPVASGALAQVRSSLSWFDLAQISKRFNRKTQGGFQTLGKGHRACCRELHRVC